MWRRLCLLTLIHMKGKPANTILLIFEVIILLPKLLMRKELYSSRKGQINYRNIYEFNKRWRKEVFYL